MATKILDSIKRLLGIDIADFNFDDELMMHINSVFLSLSQLGVGPAGPFSIADASIEWTAFTEAKTDLEAVKSYIYLKVRMLFDPPQNSFLVNSITDQIKELEWRLQLQEEPYTLTAAADAAALLQEPII